MNSTLIDSKLLKKFWGEALATATYIRNRSPTKALQSMTSCETWTGVKPNVSHCERLENFFNSNGHTNDEKKKAILLSSIGPSAYKLLRSLVSPHKPGDKTYQELVEIMKMHHNPTLSEPG